jgi:hypothetical protein
MNAVVATALPRPNAPGVLHLVRFDLRRCRLLAGTMVAIEVARAAFVEWSLRLAPTRIGGHIAGQFGGTFGTVHVEFLDAVLWLATALTTAAIVQNDWPSDDRGFWRTRPIAPRTLALAKLTTFALLFVVLPALINAGRLFAAGAPVAAIVAASTQIAVQAASVVVPAWGLALITGTLPRFIGAAIGGIVGLFGLWTVILFFWGSTSFVSNAAFVPVLRDVLYGWQRIDALGWGAAAAISIAAVAILIGHYQHGRCVLSLTAAALLFLTPSLVPARGRPAPAAPELAGAAARLGVVAVRPGTASPAVTEMPSRSRHLLLLFTLPPLPIDAAATVSVKQAHVSAGGRDVVSAAEQCCFSGGPLAVIAPTLAAPRSAEGFHAVPAIGSRIDVVDSERPDDRTASIGAVSIDAEAEIRFRRYRLAATGPLSVGATIRVGDRVIQILAVEPQHSALLVRYAQFPSLAGAGDPALSLFIGDRARTRVAELTHTWRGRQRPVQALIGSEAWGRGRQWAGRFHVLLLTDRSVFAPDAQLYVVETLDAGATRTRLSVRDSQPSMPPKEAR